MDRSTHNISSASPGPRREPRLPVLGIGFVLQKNRLLLDEQGEQALDCRIRNKSEHGYCVELGAPHKLPQNLTPGMRLVLEIARGVKQAVELRWVANNRMGLMRLEV